MKRLFKLCLSVCVMAGVLLVGCSNDSAASAPAEKKSEASASTSLEGKKVGYSAYTLNGPYYGALYETIKAETEKAGMTFIGPDAQMDFQKQISDVEDLLTQGVDILILNPLEPASLNRLTKEATAEGIPVVVVDSMIDEGADIVSQVLADNPNNGAGLGQVLAEKMGSTQIKMAVISGRQGNPVGKARRTGLFAGLVEAQLQLNNVSDYEIVTQLWGGWDEQGGVKAMEDALAGYPDINVVFAENDSMALGAIRVLKQANKLNDVVVVGYDGNKQAYDAIKSGDLFATALNNPFLMGEKAVEVGIEYLGGKTNFPRMNPISAGVITADNVADYYSRGF